MMWLANAKYSRDCGWPRRPWPNAGRREKPRENDLFFWGEKKLGNFYFFTKKSWFFGGFLDFLRPAFGHGRLGHPQSLEYYNIYQIYHKFLKCGNLT